MTVRPPVLALLCFQLTTQLKLWSITLHRVLLKKSIKLLLHPPWSSLGEFLRSVVPVQDPDALTPAQIDREIIEKCLIPDDCSSAATQAIWAAIAQTCSSLQPLARKQLYGNPIAFSERDTIQLLHTLRIHGSSVQHLVKDIVCHLATDGQERLAQLYQDTSAPLASEVTSNTTPPGRPARSPDLSNVTAHLKWLGSSGLAFPNLQSFTLCLDVSDLKHTISPDIRALVAQPAFLDLKSFKLICNVSAIARGPVSLAYISHDAVNDNLAHLVSSITKQVDTLGLFFRVHTVSPQDKMNCINFPSRLRRVIQGAVVKVMQIAQPTHLQLGASTPRAYTVTVEDFVKCVPISSSQLHSIDVQAQIKTLDPPSLPPNLETLVICQDTDTSMNTDQLRTWSQRLCEEAPKLKVISVSFPCDLKHDQEDARSCAVQQQLQNVEQTLAERGVKATFIHTHTQKEPINSQ